MFSHHARVIPGWPEGQYDEIEIEEEEHNSEDHFPSITSDMDFHFELNTLDNHPLKIPGSLGYNIEVSNLHFSAIMNHKALLETEYELIKLNRIAENSVYIAEMEQKVNQHRASMVTSMVSAIWSGIPQETQPTLDPAGMSSLVETVMSKYSFFQQNGTEKPCCSNDEDEKQNLDNHSNIA